MQVHSALLLLFIVGLFAGCSAQEPARLTGKEPLADSRPESSQDYLGAVGIGVRDLKVSTAFYQQVLGLRVLRTYELGYIEEIVLGYPDAEGAVLVLMHWPGDSSRRYDGSDVKNVFYIKDPKAAMQRIRSLGGKIDREATPHPAVNNALVGLGRDPDNYVVEVISLPE